MFLKNSKRASNNSGGTAQAPAKPSAASRNAAAGNAGPSLFSADLAITGDIVSEGEIQIDGSINGDVKCTNLTIGESGTITGEVHGDTIRIHGRVEGQVYGKTVFLSKTARVIGDISHESLAIEPGAYMEGHCQHVEQQQGRGSASGRASETRKASGRSTAGEDKPAGEAAGGEDTTAKGAAAASAG